MFRILPAAADFQGVLSSAFRAGRPLARQLTALLVGGVFVGASFLPPEHCHPSHEARRAVVHQHITPHVLRHVAHPTLADDDGRIAWMDGSALAGKIMSAGADHGSALPAAPPQLDALLRLAEAASPASGGVHDPPWRAAGSRAPPSSL